MFGNFQYAYLVGSIFFLLVWLILFLRRKDLRKEMIIMSLLVAPMGPLSEFFYLRDYWQPELFNGWVVGLEDLIFGFTIGGIAAVLYEEVFGRKYVKRHLPKHLGWMFAVSIAGVVLMIVGNLILGFNSVYVSIFIFLVVGVTIVASRQDLLKKAIYSGFLMGILMLIFYIFFTFVFDGVIQKWWHLKNLSGILVLGAPLEELLWGFGWGFIAGPAYEFVNGLRYRKRLT
jgi:hypothetical protein